MSLFWKLYWPLEVLCDFVYVGVSTYIEKVFYIFLQAIGLPRDSEIKILNRQWKNYFLDTSRNHTGWNTVKSKDKEQSYKQWINVYYQSASLENA